jgi:hypothetical protein
LLGYFLCWVLYVYFGGSGNRTNTKKSARGFGEKVSLLVLFRAIAKPITLLKNVLFF